MIAIIYMFRIALYIVMLYLHQSLNMTLKCIHMLIAMGDVICLKTSGLHNYIEYVLWAHIHCCESDVFGPQLTSIHIHNVHLRLYT